MQSFAMDGGLADPVIEAQKIFSAIMQAMARPGTLFPLATSARPPAPISPAMAAIALTLIDHELPAWLDKALVEASSWLGFHTGAQFTDDPSGAAFAFIMDTQQMPALEEFAQGSHEYPDRSTTLVLAVDSLVAGPGLFLTGPGIAADQRFAPTSLPADFLCQWQHNHAGYPRGVDLILVAEDSLACLPRSTQIRE